MIFNYSPIFSLLRSYALNACIIIMIFAFCPSSNLIAQKPHCHADEVLSQHLLEANLQHQIKDFKQQLSRITQNRSGGTIVELPVVFHIIHQGESIGTGPNVSNSKVNEQLQILNQDFAFLNSDRNQIPSQFASAAADTEIQFCLAKVNENGQPTNGIIRHELPPASSTNAIENNVKPQTQWDPDKYINIWIIRMPNPSILGYAYLPIPDILGTVKDGIVISHLKIGNQNSITKGRTLVHEMGHYLGLLHMWGFEEEDCNEDDQILDTPAAFAPYYGCPAYPQFTCGTSDMFMNYMDYVDDNCMFFFTEGQKNVMHGVINNQRLSLKMNKEAICNTSVSTKDNTPRESEIILYPNPCNELINISLSTDYQLSEYRIFDMKGQLMSQKKVISTDSSHKIKVSTEDMPGGLYVVRILTKSGKTLVKRFVKANI